MAKPNKKHQASSNTRFNYPYGMKCFAFEVSLLKVFHIFLIMIHQRNIDSGITHKDCTSHNYLKLSARVNKLFLHVISQT